ncbi:hypothetical protein E3Q13_04472, partial [Wallemia mellicola]
MTKKFTLEDKKRFNGAIEHVEDINSNANAKSAFVDVDEKLLISEGEDKIDIDYIDHPVYSIRMLNSSCCWIYGYETGIIGSITVAVGMDLGVDINQSENSDKKEVITAMTGAGAFICSIFAGALSDKIGRKWVL